MVHEVAFKCVFESSPVVSFKLIFEFFVPLVVLFCVWLCFYCFYSNLFELNTTLKVSLTLWLLLVDNVAGVSSLHHLYALFLQLPDIPKRRRYAASQAHNSQTANHYANNHPRVILTCFGYGRSCIQITLHITLDRTKRKDILPTLMAV